MNRTSRTPSTESPTLMNIEQPSEQWPRVGVYPTLSPRTYHGVETCGGERIVSRSLLRDFDPNPLRWSQAGARTVTEGMRWGSLLDCLVLTPQRFGDVYAVTPETYEANDGPRPWNANAKVCQEWRDSLPRGVEAISAGTYAKAQVAKRELYANEEFAELMEGARTQVALRYDFGAEVHGQSGRTVPVKALLDIVPSPEGSWKDTLADLKTTNRLNDLHDVERTIVEFGYHVQAALYLDLWNGLTGEQRDCFVFFFQLRDAPYETATVFLGEDAIEEGRRWYRAALRKWAQCRANDRWTSPWSQPVVAGLPKPARG